MNFKSFYSKFWPILLIIFVWLIFIGPYFINNKVPFSSTYQATFFSPWNSYKEYVGPVKNEAMPDVIDQIYPWRHLAIEIWKTGQVPLWNPYSFSGTPLLANYQSAVFSPVNFLFIILPFIDAWRFAVLLQPLLAGLFMYLYIRSINLSKSGGIMSAISFMFCGFITTWMGYVTLGYAFLFLPLAFYAVEKYYQRAKIRFLFLLSASIPLSFFSGHFQISLYFLISLLIYIVYKFISTKSRHNTLHVMLYVFFGLLLSLPQLLPSIEFYLQSFRSTLFQKGEVIPLGYLPTLLSPDFFGNPVTRNDWFGHYAEWNGYIGLTPLIFAVYAIWSKKNSRSIFFFIVGILALLLALNTPLSSMLVLFKIPVLSTSAMSRIIVIYIFSFSVLSAYGLDCFTEDFKNKKFKKIFFNLILFGCLFLALWMVVLLKVLMPLDKIIIARQNLILPSLFFLSLIFIIFIGFVLRQKRKTIITVYFVILFLTAFDLLRFVNKWLPYDPKSLAFQNVPVTDEFSKISGPDRVFGNFGAEVSNYYNLPSIEGYDALYIKDYGEFIASLDDGKVKEAARSVVIFSKNGLYIPQAINLLNIKYLVHKLSDNHEVWAFPFWTYPENQFRLIYKDQKYEIYENLKSFPHSFLVSDYKSITNPQDVINTIFGSSFNLRNQVVLDRIPDFNSVKGILGESKIEKYTPNDIKIKVQVNREGLLILTDAYYPGWQARVDGKITSIYKADYIFRAIRVPQGTHNVELIYNPLSFRLGICVGIVGVLGIFGFGLILRRKKN